MMHQKYCFATKKLHTHRWKDMQEFQLEGFKPVFSGVNFVTSRHCYISTGFIIHQDYLDLDIRLFVVIMILMAMLILMISLHMKVATFSFYSGFLPRFHIKAPSSVRIVGLWKSPSHWTKILLFRWIMSIVKVRIVLVFEHAAQESLCSFLPLTRPRWCCNLKIPQNDLRRNYS